MTLNAEKTVGEIAAEYPAAARVFEKHHIDYCCGGKHPVAEACRVAGVRAEDVMAEVERASWTPLSQEVPDWNTAPLKQLIQHILDKHHARLREELPLIGQLLQRMTDLHGARFLPLQRAFAHLRSELESHMQKEETFLFPSILLMERAVAAGGPIPKSPFGSVRHPILMMEQDHEVMARGLDEIRDITYRYDLPEDACMSFRALYRELQALEADLHTHMHLENKIVLPRAAGYVDLAWRKFTGKAVAVA